MVFYDHMFDIYVLGYDACAWGPPEQSEGGHGHRSITHIYQTYGRRRPLSETKIINFLLMFT